METLNLLEPNEPERTAFLNLTELNNPFLVIDYFFDSSYLFTVREMWWDMLYYAFSSEEANGLPADKRAEILYLHKATLKIIEANFIINQWKLQDKMEEIRAFNE